MGGELKMRAAKIKYTRKTGNSHSKKQALHPVVLCEKHRRVEAAREENEVPKTVDVYKYEAGCYGNLMD